ncbi:MAG: (d)CMP kinase [Candidatus Adiutrix sp.]
MNTHIKKIITIDGPAGSGKSTLAKELARRLTWVYLDTGALYRALAYTALKRGIDPSQQGPSEQLAETIKLMVQPNPKGTSIFVDGEEVTNFLRTLEVSAAAPTISAWPKVRQALFGLQKSLGAQGEVVVEGRDMGTVVFPDAGLKFFLYADAETRARRRYEEMVAANQDVSYEKVLSDVNKRDAADEQRSIAPLVAADDALTINSTHMDIDGVLKVMFNAFRNRFFSDS